MAASAATSRDDEVSRWIRAHPDVSERAVASLGLEGDRLPETILATPERMVDLIQAVFTEAQRERPPESVAAGLQARVDSVRVGRGNLRRYEYTVGKLRELRNTRDENALLSGLEVALREAPDDVNRNKLQDMLQVARQQAGVASEETGEETQAELISPLCWGCCVLGCSVCIEFCISCCIVLCLLC